MKLFGLKSLEKQQVPRRLSDLSVFFLKVEDKISMWKMSFLHQKERNILITKDRSLIPDRNVYHQKDKRLNVAENMEKREPLCSDGGNINWNNHYEKIVCRFLKTLKVELHFDPVSPLLGTYIVKVNENRILKRFLHSHVHCSILYNS